VSRHHATVKVAEGILFSPDCLNDATGLGIGWMAPCPSMLRAKTV
jgi:hypothetical protein